MLSSHTQQYHLSENHTLKSLLSQGSATDSRMNTNAFEIPRKFPDVARNIAGIFILELTMMGKNFRVLLTAWFFWGGGGGLQTFS